MTAQNSNWQSFTTVKKGDVGEGLVNDWLISKGFIPYSPDAGGAHPFDRLVASRDKKTIFIADVKTKAKRKYYPDTGIDIKHYQEYKFIQKKYAIDVFIFFVDEEASKIYGNFIRTLDRPLNIIHNGKELNYPMEQNGIHYFSIENMKSIVDIPQAQAEQLKIFTTKKETYK